MIFKCNNCGNEELQVVEIVDGISIVDATQCGECGSQDVESPVEGSYRTEGG